MLIRFKRQRVIFRANTTEINMAQVAGFPPIVSANSRVLILGSMPGIASLEANQYYAHPRNAFWRIMGELLGAGAGLSYQQRVAVLEKNGIALWDVLSQCYRPGSLDAAIDPASAQVNEFSGFFKKHRSIRRVFFNGGKAADLYRRRILPVIELEAPYLAHERLPSTSPAYAAMRFAEKLERWRVVTGGGLRAAGYH
jgi:hypoxanthine-DNA glycosylase